MFWGNAETSSNWLAKTKTTKKLCSYKLYIHLFEFIKYFRQYCDDEIVIFTGFYKDEIINEIRLLKQYKNIIIKYGRYIPNHEKHYDDVLGVYLISDNQYAEKIS